MKKYMILGISILGMLVGSKTDALAQMDTVTTETMDQEFVNRAISMNRFEIALASQAMERSSSAEVKQFAQKLVTDHSRTMEELEQAAIAKKLVMPDAIEENQASILKAVGELSGDDFNSAFKDVIVKSHEDAIALFTWGGGENGINDPELRTWAGEKVPVLKSHLEMAKALKASPADDVAKALSIL